MTDDPMDGYRGTPLNLARRVEQADDQDALWRRLYLGEAAKRLMTGVAKRPDIAHVMAAMIAQCEINVQRAAQAFIAMDDPGSPEARHEHFLARVEAGILGRLNQCINDGLTAADQLNGETE